MDEVAARPPLEDVPVAAALRPLPGRGRQGTGRSFAEVLMRLGACFALLVIATAVAVAADRLLQVQNVLLVFLPVILFSAVRYGFRWALGCSVLSFASSSYFLAHPLFSFAVRDPENLWALLFFLLVAGLTSTLAAQLRRRGEALRRHSRMTEELYGFSSILAALSDRDNLLQAAAESIGRRLDANVLILLPEKGALAAPGATGLLQEKAEREAANWCWTHGEAAGRGASVAGNARGSYLPLATGRGTVGVLALYPNRDPSAGEAGE